MVAAANDSIPRDGRFGRPAVDERATAHTTGPAAIFNSCYDFLASNAVAQHMLFDADSDGLLPNLIWRTFLDPAYGEPLVNVNERRRNAAALLRLSYASHVGDPPYEMLIAEISALSAEFRFSRADQIRGDGKHYQTRRRENPLHRSRPTALLKRFIRPEEIGSFVAFLASEESSAINGAALRADGGVVKP